MAQNLTLILLTFFVVVVLQKMQTNLSYLASQSPGIRSSKIKWWGEGTATLNRRFSKGHPEVIPRRFISLLTILLLSPVLAYNSVKGTTPISFPDLKPVLTQSI